MTFAQSESLVIQKFKNGITLDADEAFKALHGIAHFIDSLEKYAHWLRDENNVVLPGREDAIDQVNQEVAKYRTLQLKLYNTCEVTYEKTI